MSGIPYLKSPLDDPRVTWMYELNKEALKIQLAKYRLNITGNTAKLHACFVDYWRNPIVTTALAAGLDLHSDRLSSPPTSLMVKTSGESDQAYLRRWQAKNNELTIMREILSLYRNSDAESVKRTLTSMVQTGRGPTCSLWGPFSIV